LTVAAVALVAPLTASAGTVSGTNNGTTTPLCDSYASLSITPDGNLQVVGCVPSGGTVTPPGGTTPPPAAGALIVSATGNNALLQSGWNNIVWFSRTGGTAGSVNANVSVSPSSSCQLGSSFVSWGDGNSSDQAVGVNALNGATSCTVTINSATGGASVGTPASFTMTSANAGNGNGSGTGGTQSCNLTLASNTQAVSFGYGVNTLINMPSGAVAYGPLVSAKTSTGGAYSAGEVLFESTSSAPTDGDIEISINHCKGAIDTSGGACYSKYFVPNSVNWTESATAVLNNCMADPNATTGPSSGPWYINVRFNYTRCSWGQCGYVGQLLTR
jgi:hypothetical protein